MSPKNLRGQLALVPCMSCGEGATADPPLVVRHKKGTSQPTYGGPGTDRKAELRAWGCPQRLVLQQKAGCLAVSSTYAALGPPYCLMFQSPTALTQTQLLLTAQLYPRPPTHSLMG